MWNLLLACASAPPAEPPAPAPEPAGHGATISHRFDDAAHWATVFDDPAREAWQKPDELVAALRLAEGNTVADVGAGTGYFEAHLARAVGPTGKVLAIDVEPALITHLTARVAKEGWTVVEPRLTSPDDPGLRPGEVDLVLIVDTWHHLNDRLGWLRRLQAGVKPGGRLVVVDFDPASDDDHGPPKAHRLAPEVVEQEAAEAGWTLLERPAILPSQYVRVFSR